MVSAFLGAALIHHYYLKNVLHIKAPKHMMPEDGVVMRSVH